MTGKTVLVSVMAANNEIGVLQPLPRSARSSHERGALLHTDAAQAAGKVPLDVDAMGVDLLSLTGAQVLRPEGRRRALRPAHEAASCQLGCQIDGGGHENGLRSGTLNVPGHRRPRRVPPRSAAREMPARVRAARRRCAIGCSTGCAPSLDGVRVNGSLERRLPHNLHVSFDGVEGEALLMALGDLAVSTGSACSSGSQAPSHVLQAIGAVGDGAGASIRFGLGRWTTDADIDFAIDRVTTVVRSLRQRQPRGARSVRASYAEAGSLSLRLRTL